MRRFALLTTALLTLGNAAMAQFDNEVWPPKEKTNLYARIGGIHKLSMIVDKFGDRLAMNKTILMNPNCAKSLLPESLPYFKYLMTQYLGAKWGGPQKYMGPDFVDWHRQAMITDDEWKAGAMEFQSVMSMSKVDMDTQKMIGDFFAQFRHEMMMPSKGMMREMMMPGKDTLYMRLGGAPAIAAVCDTFVNRLAGNSVVTGNKNVVKSLTSGRVTDAGIKYLLIEQLVMATGGPASYSGRDMATAHKGLGITENEWAAAAGILKQVLDDFHVPAREQGEIFAAIGGTKKDIVGK